VRAIALALPDVEEGTAYGSPALKVGGKLFACTAINKSVEPGTLALYVGFFERDALIADDPATFYLTGHYRDHPIVLVRLARVRESVLRKLVRAARDFVSSRGRRPRARA